MVKIKSAATWQVACVTDPRLQHRASGILSHVKRLLEQKRGDM
ncbi:hypothetical protein [Sulfuriferula sp. AH1]|nr:hypothetical protein [Sulfuriferula sp. AH1]